MDQAPPVPAGIWSALVDGSPQSIASGSWINATTLDLVVSGANPTVSGILYLEESNVNVRNLGGSYARRRESVVYFP